MNNIDILQKTKELLGDYMLICQNSGISISDFIAARREAIYELQMFGNLSNCFDATQYKSQNTPSEHSSQIQKNNPGFDPFRQDSLEYNTKSSLTPQYTSETSLNTSKNDRMDNQLGDISQQKATEANNHSTEQVISSHTDDPFFALIRKIQD